MKLRILLIALTLLGTIAARADERNDSLVMRSVVNSMQLPEERVFLHFDNSGYYLGETMWFKAYVTSGIDNRATSISRVLYVELVAPEGYVVEKKSTR